MQERMRIVSPVSIKEVFLSEVVPAVEVLSEDRLLAHGHTPSEETPLPKKVKPQPLSMGNHSHPFYEMCFGITGRCIISIESRGFPFYSGDVSIFAPGVKHCEVCTAEEIPYRLMWSSVTTGHVRLWMCEFSKEHLRTLGGMDVAVDAKSLFDEIVHEIKNRKYGSFSVIKSDLLKTCVHIARVMERHPSRAKGRVERWHDKITREAIRYIKKNISRKLTLGEIAQALRLSPNYFCTFFSESTGFSFTEYMNRVRVDKAKELLRNSRFSIKEIADMVGFEDPAYFTRIFTRLAGKPPSQFRVP